MATSSSRVYHQDYIARIRYSNALPPPPNPPKLLDIPNTGLSGGQYTSAGFVSRLAREQPLNIEADAELGMPINLVGLPGVFDGDETSIQGLDNPPLPNPHDKPLLRPLSTLGKPNSVTSGVSFLRRTEYISSDQARSRFESTTSKDLVRPKGDTRKRKRAGIDHDDDPLYILRAITKGFDTAYPTDAHDGPDSVSGIRGANVDHADAAAWSDPRHPTDSNLVLLDRYPMLPDLDAVPDPGSYLVTKFITNPVTLPGRYESRLDVGLLRPLPQSAESIARLEEQKDAYESDPTQPKPGLPQYEYEFFLPEDSGSTEVIQQDWSSPTDLNKASGLREYASGEPQKPFRYRRIRTYETYQQSGDPEFPFDDTVALALHDNESHGTYSRMLPKAAYFYPVLQRTFIRPRRAANASKIGTASNVRAQDENKVDFLDVVFRDPDESELQQRRGHETLLSNFLASQA